MKNTDNNVNNNITFATDNCSLVCGNVICDPLAQKTKKKIVCLHQFGDSYSILPTSRLSKTDSAISVTFVFSLMEMMLSIQYCFN